MDDTARLHDVLREPPDIDAAALRLAGVVLRTPLIGSEVLDALVGARVLLKAEVLQRTGSFKFRGAYNSLRLMSGSRGGVVAFSSGNHAHGVADAARLLQMPAVVVIPRDAPATKIHKVERLGAEIVFYDRARDDRELMAATIAAERHATVLPSYDAAPVIAGQGTVGLEAAHQAAEAGLRLDLMIVPAGGGGLLAGVALALARHSPATRVYSAEPVGLDNHARSLAVGRRMRNAVDAHSICDALLAPLPGRLTFSLSQPLLAGGVVATDQEVCNAMAFAFEHLKLVVEPGGAIALAALLAGRIEARNRVIGIVLSGGNVDEATFHECLARAQPWWRH
jgi:threonine dehydratase